ncbi:MAG: hypothetical protein K0R65_1419 [Crocinitomicaceae bacterium]|jgi:thiol-disulfide isomerase/thioredoxin|nr:hypothetical protein [Crocinitomicaceae bacterium]
MRKIIYILLILLNVIFLKQVQDFALDLGLSWTFSFSLPYFLLLLFGILLAMALRPVMKRMPKALRILVLVVVAILPFGAGFILHPIYEGDYAGEGTEVKAQKFRNGKQADLVVLTISDCPFCRESTQKINRLVERNPQMRIKYVVCSTNPEATKELRSLLDKRVKIELVSELNEGLALSAGKFPTFVRIDNGKPVHKWHNMQLGVLALDKIESSLSK